MPMPSPSTTAAVSGSMRAHRAYAPSRVAAAPQMRRYQRSDTEEWRESSSSGSARPMRGPGSAGFNRYIQPVAAMPTNRRTGKASVLRATEPLRRGKVRARGTAAPDRPVVTVICDRVAKRQVESCERAREAIVLLQRVVAGPAVEPEEGVSALEFLRSPGDRQLRAVPRHERPVKAEDRWDPVRHLIPGPAFDDAELTRMVDRDVERGIAALAEPGDPPACSGANRPVPLVDGANHVARDERLPAFVRAHAVRPLLVGERTRRPERHHEDHRARAVQRDELVLHDAHPNGRKERRRPARDPVQEVEHGIVAARAGCVGRREVNVDRLPATADRGARDG